MYRSRRRHLYSRLPDVNDEQASRTRLRDCAELADNWLRIEGDHVTMHRLRGHWTIQDWSTGHDNRIVVLSYKTWLIRIRLVVQDLTQTVRSVSVTSNLFH